MNVNMMTDSDKNTSKNVTVLIDLHYLPSVAYFREVAEADHIILEAHETFQKQTFRNRCEILTSNGRESLIVPIVHGGEGYIKDVKIDYSQRWFQIHDRSIRSAYGKSPFFEFYMDEISTVLLKKHTYLWDLNLELLTLCLEKLTFKKKLSESNSYIKAQEIPDYYKDLREKILPHQHSSERQNGSPRYQQVFGNEFVTNLSIIDLLFCAVLDSPELLQ